VKTFVAILVATLLWIFLPALIFLMLPFLNLLMQKSNTGGPFLLALIMFGSHILVGYVSLITPLKFIANVKPKELLLWFCGIISVYYLSRLMFVEKFGWLDFLIVASSLGGASVGALVAWFGFLTRDDS
jgi:hypothetical protein